jgi:sugar lactone lactonase YvrE
MNACPGRLWAAIAVIIAVCHSPQSNADPVLHYPGYSIELLTSGVGAATGMAISPSGDLYVTDLGSFRVLRIQNPSAPGPHTAELYAAGIPFPNDLAFAFGERLFVTSPTGPNSEIVEVLAGGSPLPFASGFSFPVGIATWDSYLYVGNSGDGTISQVDSSGASVTFLSGFAGPHGPFGLSFDALGNLYFVVHGSGAVYKADSSGTTQLLGTVSALGGVFVEATAGGNVFVSDVLEGKLYLLDASGTHLFASGFAGKSNPPYNGPNDIVATASGTIYVADANNVWRITPSLTVVAVDIKPGSFPNSINLRSRGVVPVAILSNPTLNVVDVDVGTVKFAGALPANFSYEDVNGDGVADLVFHFHTQDLQLTSNSTEASLTGQLRSGESIVGTDAVRIVPSK